MEVNFELPEKSSYVIIFPEGNFEVENAEPFEKKVNEFLYGTERCNLLFNMSRLGYLNSMALNSFIGIYNRLLKKGYKILFCCLTPPVKLLFRITSLDIIVPVYSTEWDAVKCFDLKS